jgi:ZIP family zinc transporter
MSFAATAGLGAVAGFTILLGLPIARLGRPSARLTAFLNAAAIGILLFLLYDVVHQANNTIESTLRSSRGLGIGYGFLFAGGIVIGLLGLVLFEMVMKRRARGAPQVRAVGAMAATAVVANNASGAAWPGLSAAVRVSLSIAIGIGLHNFSEGLAIGQSARLGLYQLFGVLVIGFGLHNITEGFGIAGPLVGASVRPSWRLLLWLGVIGGGPTFAGTMLGYQTTNLGLSVLFLALAAGAIMYVVGELQHAGRRIGAHNVAMIGLAVGFLAAYGTDKLLFVVGG